MAHITLMMQPELGHLLPTVRIAFNLLARGHTVRYLSLPQFTSFFSDLHLDFRAILVDATLPVLKAGTGHWEPAEHTYRRLYATMRGRGISVADAILAELIPEASDLILLDSSLVTKNISQSLLPLQPLLVRLNVVLPDERQPELMNDVPELILCPEELELPNRLAARHERHFVEPSVLLDRPRSPCHKRNRENPLVYCSFGTQGLSYQERMKTISMVVECFCSFPDLDLLVSVGGPTDSNMFEHLPPNIFLQETVNQLHALQQASLFITHGGLGSIKESILARVPMIVVPFRHDQPMNAVRICHHELGTALLGHSWSVTDLRALVSTTMANNTVRSNLDRFYALFVNAENDIPSIRHIERFIDRGNGCARC